MVVHTKLKLATWIRQRSTKRSSLRKTRQGKVNQASQPMLARMVRFWIFDLVLFYLCHRVVKTEFDSRC